DARNYLDNNWLDGNRVPMAALVVGNRTDVAYQYSTDCYIENVDFECKKFGYTPESGPAVAEIYTYGNTAENKGVNLVINNPGFTGAEFAMWNLYGNNDYYNTYVNSVIRCSSIEDLTTVATWNFGLPGLSVELTKDIFEIAMEVDAKDLMMLDYYIIPMISNYDVYQIIPYYGYLNVYDAEDLTYALSLLENGKFAGQCISIKNSFEVDEQTYLVCQELISYGVIEEDGEGIYYLQNVTVTSPQELEAALNRINSNEKIRIVIDANLELTNVDLIYQLSYLAENKLLTNPESYEVAFVKYVDNADSLQQAIQDYNNYDGAISRIYLQNDILVDEETMALYNQYSAVFVTGEYQVMVPTEVADITSLQQAIGNGAKAVRLTGSIEQLSEEITVQNDLILDLGGNSINSNLETTFHITNGTLYVSNGSVNSTGDTFFVDATAQDSTAKLVIAEDVNISSQETNCVYIKGEGASLETAGYLTAYGSYAAIQGNGNLENRIESIKITGGSVVSNNDIGIYAPQAGELTITGGRIEGLVGIYVKSGVLNISGGEIVGTGEKADYVYNGNGAESTGDALVIDACGYPGGNPDVTITGGTFNSYYNNGIAYYKYNGNEAVGFNVNEEIPYYEETITPAENA
ncbi:MAG: hypothetical protein IJW25_02990, partial [Clostridia bacterium]|nr:hypothetical protein [Clostridia bacterium]